MVVVVMVVGMMLVVVTDDDGDRRRGLDTFDSCLRLLRQLAVSRLYLRFLIVFVFVFVFVFVLYMYLHVKQFIIPAYKSKRVAEVDVPNY